MTHGIYLLLLTRSRDYLVDQIYIYSRFLAEKGRFIVDVDVDTVPILVRSLPEYILTEGVDNREYIDASIS